MSEKLIIDQAVKPVPPELMTKTYYDKVRPMSLRATFDAGEWLVQKVVAILDADGDVVAEKVVEVTEADRAALIAIASK